MSPTDTAEGEIPAPAHWSEKPEDRHLAALQLLIRLLALFFSLHSSLSFHSLPLLLHSSVSLTAPLFVSAFTFPPTSGLFTCRVIYFKKKHSQGLPPHERIAELHMSCPRLSSACPLVFEWPTFYSARCLQCPALQCGGAPRHEDLLCTFKKLTLMNECSSVITQQRSALV